MLSSAGVRNYYFIQARYPLQSPTMMNKILTSSSFGLELLFMEAAFAVFTGPGWVGAPVALLLHEPIECASYLTRCSSNDGNPLVSDTVLILTKKIRLVEVKIYHTILQRPLSIKKSFFGQGRLTEGLGLPIRNITLFLIMEEESSSFVPPQS